jgi:UDP-glucose 4-epimerase
MAKYICTGVAGFIGSHLCDHLLTDGHTVIGIDNLASGKMENISHHLSNTNFTFLKFDITNWDHLSRHAGYFNDIDGVYHLAAKARIQFSIKNPFETHNANVTGTFNILEMMKLCRIKNIVFSSTSSMYGLKNQCPFLETMAPDCLNMYSLSKFVSEQYLNVWHDLYGINSISVRFFNVYGPREKTDGEFATVIGKFYRQILGDKKPPTMVGAGSLVRDYTYVSDIVSGNICAMNALIVDPNLSNQVFNLGSGTNHSVNDVADLILDSLNMDRSYRVYVPPRPAEVKATLACTDKAKNLLGWSPTFLLPEGLNIESEYDTKLYE